MLRIFYIVGSSLILLTQLCLFAGSSDFSVEIISNITVNVLQRYQVMCVYFVYPTEPQDFKHEKNIRDFYQYLSKENFQMAMLRLHPGHTDNLSRCVFVITSVEEIPKLQVTGVLNSARGVWLLFIDTTKPLEETFKDVYIPLSSEFLVAQQSIEAVILSEVYHVHHSRPLYTNPIGRWNFVNGTTWTTKSSVQRRSDLKGITMKAGIINFGKLAYIKKMHNKKPVECAGYVIELWRVLEEKLNFTTDYYTPESGNFGNQKSNGTWTGLMSMVIYGKVDVLLVTMALNKNRQPYVEFFRPINNDRFSVYIKEAEGSESSLMHLLEPLSITFWKAILLTMGVLTLFLASIWRTTRKNTKSPDSETYNLQTSFFLMFGTFCQRANEYSPQLWSLRFIFLTAYVTAMLVFVAYSATFISFLTVKRIKLPFRDLQGMLTNGKYLLGMLPNSAQSHVFESSADPVLKEALNKLMNPDIPPPQDNVIGLTRVCDRQTYSFMILDIAQKVIRPSLSCRTVRIPDFFIPAPLGVMGQKNTPLRHILNCYFVKLQEFGIRRRTESRLYPLNSKHRDETPLSGVTVEKVAPIFIILFAGVVASVICLIVELFVNRVCKCGRKVNIANFL